MIARLLSKVMDWALARNGGGDYEGETSNKWAYTIRAPDGSPYLSRLLLPRVRIPGTQVEFRPMLHHFHRPDDDGELHSHPWSWAASLVLAGGYEEERLVGDPRLDRFMTSVGQCAMCARWRGECPGHPAERDVKQVRFWNYLTKDDYHRVTRLRGSTWTLFVSGPRTPDNAWGFLTEDGVHVPWQDFLEDRHSRAKKLQTMQQGEAP